MDEPDWVEEIAEALKGGPNGLWARLNTDKAKTIAWMARMLGRLSQEVHEQGLIIADLREDRGDIYLVQYWEGDEVVGAFCDRLSAERRAVANTSRHVSLVAVVCWKPGRDEHEVVSLWRRGRMQCVPCAGSGRVMKVGGYAECPACLGEGDIT